MKLEVVKKAVGLAILLATMWFGVMAMAYGLLFGSFLSMAINAWPNRRLLGYGCLEQTRDILSGIVLAVLMGVCVYPVSLLGMSPLVTLLIQVPLGAVLFVAASAVLRLETFVYLLGLLKNRRNTGRPVE